MQRITKNIKDSHQIFNNVEKFKELARSNRIKSIEEKIPIWNSPRKFQRILAFLFCDWIQGLVLSNEIKESRIGSIKVSASLSTSAVAAAVVIFCLRMCRWRQTISWRHRRLINSNQREKILRSCSVFYVKDIRGFTKRVERDFPPIGSLNRTRYTWKSTAFLLYMSVCLLFEPGTMYTSLYLSILIKFSFTT